MRIACVQFSPVRGEVEGNIAKLEALMEDNGVLPGSLDLLLLPELALTGYNFASLRDIKPYLEVQGTGHSSLWAQETAQRLQCVVSLGYPEKSHGTERGAAGAKRPPSGLDKRFNFNSNILYRPDGTVLGHYRKNFLFPTDLTWASEATEHHGQFFTHNVPEPPLNARIALGICMDINPYKFTAPTTTLEFATRVCTSEADLVLVSMAWSSLTLRPVDLDEDANPESARQPDFDSLTYWMERFGPVIQADRSVLLVVSNRCGVEDDACYVGTSFVSRLGRGTVEVWEVLGRGTSEVICVDTERPPKYSWRGDPPSLQKM